MPYLGISNAFYQLLNLYAVFGIAERFLYYFYHKSYVLVMWNMPKQYVAQCSVKKIYRGLLTEGVSLSIVIGNHEKYIHVDWLKYIHVDWLKY